MLWFDQFMREVGLNLTAVVQLVVPDDEVVRRIIGRRVCPGCGASYHVTDRPPRMQGVCDRCGTALGIRPDDHEEVIRARLQVYHDNTDDLLRHYAKPCREVPSQASIESVYNTILNSSTIRRSPCSAHL